MGSARVTHGPIDRPPVTATVAREFKADSCTNAVPIEHQRAGAVEFEVAKHVVLAILDFEAEEIADTGGRVSCTETRPAVGVGSRLFYSPGMDKGSMHHRSVPRR